MDLVFNMKDAKKTTVAILESKRRGQLRYSDFEGATVAENATGTEIKNKIEASKEEGGDFGPDQTLLQSNGRWYFKQITTYAISRETQHVALFDWDNLVLFHFDDLKEKSAGDTASYQWIENKGSGLEHATIRATLLGWLVDAFRTKGLDPAKAGI
jgi:hypothetical protein